MHLWYSYNFPAIQYSFGQIIIILIKDSALETFAIIDAITKYLVFFVLILSRIYWCISLDPVLYYNFHKLQKIVNLEGTCTWINLLAIVFCTIKKKVQENI